MESDFRSRAEFQQPKLGLHQRVNNWLLGSPNEVREFEYIPTWLEEGDLEDKDEKERKKEIEELKNKKKLQLEVAQFLKRELALEEGTMLTGCSKREPKPIRNISANIQKLEEAAPSWAEELDSSDSENETNSSTEPQEFEPRNKNIEHAPTSFAVRAQTAQGNDRLRALGVNVSQVQTPLISPKALRKPNTHGIEPCLPALVLSPRGNSTQNSLAYPRATNRPHWKGKARISRFTEENVDFFREEPKTYRNEATRTRAKPIRSYIATFFGSSSSLRLSGDAQEENSSPNSRETVIYNPSDPNNKVPSPRANNSIPPFNPNEDFHTNDKEHWHLLGLSRKPARSIVPAQVTAATTRVRSHSTPEPAQTSTTRYPRKPTPFEIDARVAAAYVSGRPHNPRSNPPKPPKPAPFKPVPKPHHLSRSPSLFELTPSEATAETPSSFRECSGTLVHLSRHTARQINIPPRTHKPLPPPPQSPREIFTPPIPYRPPPGSKKPTRCRGIGCPLKFRHNKGLYLHEGELRPRKEGEMWGASNPPPEIWEAYFRIKDEEGYGVGQKPKNMVRAEDVRAVQKFAKFHYGRIKGDVEEEEEEKEEKRVRFAID